MAGFLPEFTWRTTQLPDGVRVDLGGPITIAEAPALWKRVSELLEGTGDKRRVQIDNSAVEVIDGGCMALLVHLRSELEARPVDLFQDGVAVLDFLGQLVSSAWHSLRHPRSINFRDIALTMERAGADAAPIVLLINFLIGFVIAYQSALQLKQFGASIFIADLARQEF